MRMTTSDRQLHGPCTALWMIGLLIGLPFLEGCAPSAATLAVTEACEADDVPALRQLVVTGAHRNRIQIGDEPIEDSWMYPIHAAAQYGSAVALEVFLAAGCNPNQRDSDEKTPLMYLLEGEAADDATILQCIGMLMESGADVNCASKRGNTALHYAAMYHSRQIVSRLLDYGADVDAVNRLSNSPLHLACETSLTPRKACVVVLLEGGADKTLKNEFGETPHDICTKNPKCDFVELLVEQVPLK